MEKLGGRVVQREKLTLSQSPIPVVAGDVLDQLPGRGYEDHLHRVAVRHASVLLHTLVSDSSN